MIGRIVFLCFFVFMAVEGHNVCWTSGVNPHGGRVAHNSNCNQYWECKYGVPFIKSCPKFKHFSPTTKSCEWPRVAGCKPVTEQTTTLSPDSRCNYSSQMSVCPTHNPNGLAVHLPHKNCKKFYKCDWGVAYEFDCPATTHFNAKLQVCDWPANAGCQC